MPPRQHAQWHDGCAGPSLLQAPFVSNSCTPGTPPSLPLQVLIAQRLGYFQIFNHMRPALHYRLRMWRPDEHEVAWQVRVMLATQAKIKEHFLGDDCVFEVCHHQPRTVLFVSLGVSTAVAHSATFSLPPPLTS